MCGEQHVTNNSENIERSWNGTSCSKQPFVGTGQQVAQGDLMAVRPRPVSGLRWLSAWMHVAHVRAAEAWETDAEQRTTRSEVFG